MIRKGLAGFASSFEQNPGRLNVYDGHAFRVILDYAHNPAGLTALGDLLTQMRAHYGRVIGMVSIPGDRRDEDILPMGQIAAGVFDDPGVPRSAGWPRPHQRGGQRLLTEGALRPAWRPDGRHRIIDEHDAAEACLRHSAAGGPRGPAADRRGGGLATGAGLLPRPRRSKRTRFRLGEGRHG